MEKEIYRRDLEPKKKKNSEKKYPNLFQISVLQFSKRFHVYLPIQPSQELGEVGKIYLSVLQAGKTTNKTSEAQRGLVICLSGELWSRVTNQVF